MKRESYFNLMGHVNSLLSKKIVDETKVIYTEWPDNQDEPNSIVLSEEVKDFLRTTSDVYCVVAGYPFEKKFGRIVNESFGKDEITLDDFLKVLKTFVKRFKRYHNQLPEDDLCHTFDDYYFEGMTMVKNDEFFVNDGYLYFDFGS